MTYNELKDKLFKAYAHEMEDDVCPVVKRIILSEFNRLLFASLDSETKFRLVCDDTNNTEFTQDNADLVIDLYFTRSGRDYHERFCYATFIQWLSLNTLMEWPQPC